MSEQTSFQLKDQPVTLVIDSAPVLVENHWVEPEGPEDLELVERSEDLLVLRMSLRGALFPGCMFIFVWLSLQFFLLSLQVLPVGVNISPGGLLATAMILTLFVLAAWAMYVDIRKYINGHFYFDWSNRLIVLGALPGSPCYALSDLIAIQLLERNDPNQKRSLQLNLVLIRKESTTLRINLQSANPGSIERWPNCLGVMMQSANRLAAFLDVPLIEQRAPDLIPIQEKLTDDAKEINKKEMEKLHGTWLLVENDGRELANEGPSRTLVREGGARFRVKRGQDITLQGEFKIDPTQEPKFIDMIPISGRDRGKTYLGIYILDGDVYRECFAAVGRPRPKELQFQPGLNRLRVYKRIK